MIYKLDNVTSLTAARWAAAEGFEYISFNFDKTDSSYISPMKVAEIRKWVTGIKFSGKFLNAEPSVISDLYTLLNLDAIEIDLKTAEILLMDHDIPSLLQIEKDSIVKAIEFQKINPNVFAFYCPDEIEVPTGLSVSTMILPSRFKGNLGVNSPFGISFDSANETEPGLVDFEELEILKNHWKNSINCI